MNDQVDSIKLLMAFGANPDLQNNGMGLSSRSLAAAKPSTRLLFVQSDQEILKEARSE